MKAKLYELERDKGVKIHFPGGELSWEDNGDKTHVLNPVIIFGHIDGMYSYCWVENHPKQIVHLQAGMEVETYKDGWKPVDNDATDA